MEIKKIFFKAIQLAKSVKGNTSPNPAVGCIIVKNGRIVGKGATQKSGCDHAEIAALKEAKLSAKNASLYVTLEPCVDYPGKKTPSCASAIIKAGIKEVFVGMKDPNPHIKGKGIIQLKKAGIKVTLLKENLREIYALNEDFFKYIQTSIPFVYAKSAMTLDGNIATEEGDSKWISSEESRTWVHQLRNRVDAVLVGVGTVIMDNPRLNVRLVPKMKDPLRIIVDPEGRTPLNSFVMKDKGKTLFVVKKSISKSFLKECEKKHKEVLTLNTYPNTGFHLKKLVRYLGKEKGIESLLIEGGGRVFHHALHEKIIDKLIVFIAPKILGGKGLPLFNGKTSLKMSEALKINDISVENSGGDILVEGYLQWGKQTRKNFFTKEKNFS